MSKSCIIGDVHGCFNTFIQLLDKLPKDIDQIYTVGDIIDRGSMSKEVVQECIVRGIISVRGNHEDMFLDRLREENTYDRGVFEMNGGMATLASYARGVPDSHLEYFINMPYYIETDDFILSHAGVPAFIEDKFRDHSSHSRLTLMWDRGFKAKNLDKLQVFGHCPIEYVKFAKQDERFVHINVDTSCAKSGYLTAVVLPDREIIQVRNNDDKVPNLVL